MRAEPRQIEPYAGNPLTDKLLMLPLGKPAQVANSTSQQHLARLSPGHSQILVGCRLSLAVKLEPRDRQSTREGDYTALSCMDRQFKGASRAWKLWPPILSVLTITLMPLVAEKSPVALSVLAPAGLNATL